MQPITPVPPVDSETLIVDSQRATASRGYRTSEFQITVALIVLDALGTAFGFLPGQWAMTAATITGVVYKAARTFQKLYQESFYAVELPPTAAPLPKPNAPLSTPALIALLLCVVALTGCATWTPEKRLAVLHAVEMTALDFGLQAAQQYSADGSISKRQLAFDGISGAAQLLRSLEMPNQPSTSQIEAAVRQGSGNPQMARQLAPPIAVAIASAIVSGAPPAAAVESSARGLDAAAAQIALAAK